LTGGALRKTGRNRASIAFDLEAFLSLGIHERNGPDGHHQHTELVIVENAPAGQFEFYFCGFDCLRNFFSRCVDALEKKRRGNR
jgi:hypothetical protein